MRSLVDRCAACFTPLTPAPLGGRYACRCHPPNNFRPLRGRYLSEVVPESPHAVDAAVVSKHGRPALHLYGSKT